MPKYIDIHSHVNFKAFDADRDEVIKRALSGVPFPPKSTRHIIPERIIRLNMRLGWLHQSEDEAKKYLERMLEDRLYNGNIRRYTEPVIVIY